MRNKKSEIRIIIYRLQIKEILNPGDLLIEKGAFQIVLRVANL